MRLKAWLPAMIILEVGAAMIAFAAIGESTAHSPGGGNRIARMVLENPGPVESFVFYFLLAHLLILLFIAAARVFARP